ncbi:hypothetical protein D1872_233710 [compost metagenome]
MDFFVHFKNSHPQQRSGFQIEFPLPVLVLISFHPSGPFVLGISGYVHVVDLRITLVQHDLQGLFHFRKYKYRSQRIIAFDQFRETAFQRFGA